MPKARSVLEDLSETQQEQLIHWLECHPTRTVVEMVAKPPPDGFGLQTHVTTLRRFYARYQASLSAEELELAKLIGSASGGAPIQNATDALLSEWAFQIATNPQRTNGAFKALCRWALKNREQAQREAQLELNKERLSLDREKFEFNAARQALLHHADLARIMQDPNSDNEDKIQAARRCLFPGKGGSAQNGTTPESQLPPFPPVKE
jgi:hypothetical protein